MKSNLAKLMSVSILSLLVAIVNLGAPGVTARQAKEGTISGNWESVLKVGDQRLRLVLKVNSGTDGTLSAVVDSLDQANANNLQVDSITFQNNVLHFEMKKLYIVYEGTMNKEGSEIAGTFTQAGNAFQLTFRKPGLLQ